MRRGFGWFLALAAGVAGAADLGGGAQWIEGGLVPGRQPDGNSVLLRGTQGWIVVDSGRHPEHAQKILDAVAGSGLPIAAVVNTHWHLDHVSGNARLREAFPGLRVFASDAIDGALDGFLANYRKQLVEMQAQADAQAAKDGFAAEIARIDAGPKLRPDEVVTAPGERTLAGRSLQVNLAAHAATAGDVWLYDPAAKLAIAGDLVTLPAPFLDTACAPRWREALGDLQATGFETLVPGHGKPMRRAEFAQYRRAVDGLYDCAASDAEPGECAARWARDAAPLLAGQDADLTRGLIEYYVGQRLRGEGAKADCP